MGRIPQTLKHIIANNIRSCRMKKFPGRGGSKKCAQAFGVSPQQWSPWERGMRTPDEIRLSEIAKFFGVTVEDLRRDKDGSRSSIDPSQVGMKYPVDRETPASYHPIREFEAPQYGLPSLSRLNEGQANAMAEISFTAARLIELVGSTQRGVAEGKIDSQRALIVIRRLTELLEQKLREAGQQ